MNVGHKTMGDLWGGIAAVSVTLPQAMAFGAALFAVFGATAASGAMAGLIAAIAFSLASGLAGGTRGMVSAPTGPTFVLLSGTAVAFLKQGVAADQVWMALVWVLLIAGAMQLLIGLSNAGRLIKFIPYPVITGFMTGSAVLMVMSQVHATTGTGWRNLAQTHWLPLATALITMIAIVLTPRVTRRVPGPIGGLIVGTLVFYTLQAAGQVTVPAAWAVGAMPGLESLRLTWPAPAADLPWLLIIAAALALAVLASLDTLLTSIVADQMTHSRHDARRELVGQGGAHLLAGLAGGIAGAGTTGASVIAIHSGGGRWVGVATAAVLAMLLAVAAPLAAWLPLSVLAGIILHVAFFSMVDRNLPLWLRHHRTRLDGLIAVGVMAVTVFYDLMMAVGVGVLVTVIQFIREQVRSSVVHERFTAAQRPSLRRRTAREQGALKTHGGRLIVYRLKGDLFFGTADQLFAEIKPDLESPNFIVLDLHRVKHVDLTALHLLRQMAVQLDEAGGELVFARVHEVHGLKHEVQQSLSRIDREATHRPVRTFIDTDEAQEQMENELLGRAGCAPAGPGQAIAAREIELFADLDARGVEDILALARRETVEEGRALFRAGDVGDELYIVISGNVDIRLPFGDSQYRRVASFGPGTYFGEVAFLERGPRTADAWVRQASELLVLDQQALATLRERSPRAAATFLHALSRSLGRHLRWADAELRRLSS